LQGFVVLGGGGIALPACAEEPVLRIAKQGSMEAGGKTIYCATNDGGDPDSKRWPSGHVVVDNVYATYQYPADQRYPYAVLFNSGGGHTARVYDTTPDGREGWLTLFLRQGFPVYGVDRTNTGRSGTDICKINAVRLGKAPVDELPAINRYPAESSWVTFSGALSSANLIPTRNSPSNLRVLIIHRRSAPIAIPRRRRSPSPPSQR
jgi:hypothetical protein